MIAPTPKYIFAGQLRRDYVILPSGKALSDIPGGNLIYAAAGLALWEPEPPPALVARVGEDYPHEWIDDFEHHGFDVRGIRVLPEAVDLRSFYAYGDRNVRFLDDPVAHFSKVGLTFPKTLLGYQPTNSVIDSRTKLNPTSIRQGDIITEYLDATAAHICPVDYLTHTLIPAVLRQAGFTTITLDPSPGYMNPTYWDEIPALITGLTAFIAAEEEMRALFLGRSANLWEMSETLAGYGCEFIVIKRGEGGQLLYDSASHSRWEIPAYAAQVQDPTGAGDAFCGGFLAGYRRTYDPVQAVLHGNISASITVEGYGVFYALDALPGLAQARLDALIQTVRKV
jgi:hypothetical protein